MERRHSGLTQATADYNHEGLRVCLDRHHKSPISFDIRTSDRRGEAVVEWEKADERTKHAWANEIDTTEIGAYACVLAALELFYDLVTVRRAETATGADYYVAPPGTPADDLEDCIRLEVSGVDHGNIAVVDRRLRDKLRQAAEGSSNLPAIAGVVGFRVRLIRLANLVEP